MIKLRPYQKEIVDLMNDLKVGSYLIQLPTGCGKTICFTSFINMNNKNILILSHREELVNQPVKYINREVGVEMSKQKSNNESVIAASVQSLVRRLEKFDKNYFDVIIIDEAHHSSAKSYRKILDYFSASLKFGFTATPNRNDSVRLNDVFDKIIYKMNLITAVKQGYLTDIKCIRSYLNYDISKCRKNKDDYNLEDLNNAMGDTAIGIAEVYDKKAKGQTLIFGVSVEHCKKIMSKIPGSVMVDATTKNRERIIEDFTNRKFKCLINCMIFTEGTDIPLIETIIIARPTQNESLYTQMVGRGLRLYEGKTHLNLIDCVGVCDNLSMCTAPSLIGIKYDDSKVKDKNLQCESLIDLPDIVRNKMDNIHYWKINYKTVNLWAKAQKYNLHNINFYQLPDGYLTLKLPNTKIIKVKYPDELGKSNDSRDFQEVIDDCYTYLEKNHNDYRYIWDLSIMKKWGRKPASYKQIETIEKITGQNVGMLSKLEASQILNRLFNK